MSPDAIVYLVMNLYTGWRERSSISTHDAPWAYRRTCRGSQLQTLASRRAVLIWRGGVTGAAWVCKCFIPGKERKSRSS